MNRVPSRAIRQARLLAFACLAFVVACGSSGNESAADASAGADSAGGGPDGGLPPADVGPGEGGPPDAPTFSGVGCPEIGLPSVGTLRNVTAKTHGANANIAYELFDGAKDYRVYAVPDAKDLSADGTIKNGLYRCAGLRESPAPLHDDETEGESGRNVYSRTRVASEVEGYKRTMTEATLGYVYSTPGAGRTAVYALGDPAKDADTDCQIEQYTESRVKTYTTSEAERTTLLAARWRDDGIAFYVPTAAAGAHPIYLAQGTTTLYLPDGAEATARKAKGAKLLPAFSALDAAGTETLPLMRVFYANICGRSHDELMAGKPRFERAFQQTKAPVDALHWSGLTGKTTLVIEAMDELCPFPGTLSPMHRPAQKVTDGLYSTDYAPFVTLDEAHASSPNGEVFVGGQGVGTHPKAVARACITVEPAAAPSLDFSFTGMDKETFNEAKSTGFQTWEFDSANFNVQFHTTETNEWAVGNMLGELWLPHADWAADTNGKFRLTPKTKTSLADGTFTHVTLETDSFSTHRRYPQIMISTGLDWPVQANLEKGTTVLIQTIHTWPTSLQVQLCDHRTWDVNNQCPYYDLFHMKDPKDGSKTYLAPNVSVADQGGVDRTNVFDVYISTKRVYVYMNSESYGCVELPAGKMPAGPAVVTFGDVLYHSGADLEVFDPIHLAQMHFVTSRHFSNLGFKSGLPEPTWDHARFPCVASDGLQPF